MFTHGGCWKASVPWTRLDSTRADELLTVKAVAELLKLNQQTIRNIIDRGELGHVRVGQRRVRVRQSQLDAFLAAGESSPQSAEADPWQAVSEAAKAAAAAVREHDREALDRAISQLSDAAQEIPSEPVGPASRSYGVGDLGA